eukprot:4261296-Pyramimonas_sp.AAC.1
MPAGVGDGSGYAHGHFQRQGLTSDPVFTMPVGFGGGSDYNHDHFQRQGLTSDPVPDEGG